MHLDVEMPDLNTFISAILINRVIYFGKNILKLNLKFLIVFRPVKFRGEK